MNRRSFIQRTGLAMGGVLLAQGLTASAAQLCRASELPAISEHVRHGAFSLRPVKNPFLPKWINIFSRHRFYQDGISQGMGDFETITIQLGEQYFNIGITAEELMITTDEEVLSWPRNEADASLALADERFTIASYPSELKIQEEAIILILEGTIRIQGESFEKNEFLVSQRGVIECSDSSSDALILMIEKKEIV